MLAPRHKIPLMQWQLIEITNPRQNTKTKSLRNEMFHELFDGGWCETLIQFLPHSSIDNEAAQFIDLPAK